MYELASKCPEVLFEFLWQSIFSRGRVCDLTECCERNEWRRHRKRQVPKWKACLSTESPCRVFHPNPSSPPHRPATTDVQAEVALHRTDTFHAMTGETSARTVPATNHAHALPAIVQTQARHHQGVRLHIHSRGTAGCPDLQPAIITHETTVAQRTCVRGTTGTADTCGTGGGLGEPTTGHPTTTAVGAATGERRTMIIEEGRRGDVRFTRMTGAIMTAKGTTGGTTDGTPRLSIVETRGPRPRVVVRPPIRSLGVCFDFLYVDHYSGRGHSPVRRHSPPRGHCSPSPHHAKPDSASEQETPRHDRDRMRERRSISPPRRRRYSRSPSPHRRPPRPRSPSPSRLGQSPRRQRSPSPARQTKREPMDEPEVPEERRPSPLPRVKIEDEREGNEQGLSPQRHETKDESPAEATHAKKQSQSPPPQARTRSFSPTASEKEREREREKEKEVEKKPTQPYLPVIRRYRPWPTFSKLVLGSDVSAFCFSRR